MPQQNIFIRHRIIIVMPIVKKEFHMCIIETSKNISTVAYDAISADFKCVRVCVPAAK